MCVFSTKEMISLTDLPSNWFCCCRLEEDTLRAGELLLEDARERFPGDGGRRETDMYIFMYFFFSMQNEMINDNE